MSNRKVMLTTADNPYDPNTQFQQWYAFDIEKGYNTCSYLARRAYTSEGIGDSDNDAAIEEAIDAIVELNLLGNYRKLVYIDDKLQA